MIFSLDHLRRTITHLKKNVRVIESGKKRLCINSTTEIETTEKDLSFYPNEEIHKGGVFQKNGWGGG